MLCWLRVKAATMNTNTWIERLLIDQLSTRDHRYKHEYAGVERSTDELIAACIRLETLTSEGEASLQSLEQLLARDAEIEPEVVEALRTLQEIGLVERVGERERLGPLFERGDFGTTPIWKPTVEGRAEARAIREAYSEAVETLEDSYNRDS